MPQVLCEACLGIVLQNNDKAKELFDEFVDCFNLPGFKEVRKQKETAQDELSTGNIDYEIKKLERKLKKYKGQERRLMNVQRLDVVSSG